MSIELTQLNALATWRPPAHWQKITTLDMHTGGEPLRVVVGGLPPIEGSTVLEKRRYFRQHLDHLRTGLMWEPRGHADMYGAVVTPSLDADFDTFFLHNEGYSTMCGHAIIALTKMVFETGLIKPEGDKPRLKINAPCGRIDAVGHIEGGLVKETSFRNVPSFLYLRDAKVEVPGLGTVRFDIAYGGAFYAFIDASQFNMRLSADEHNQLVDHGKRIKRAIMAKFPIRHPFEEDLSFLYGTIFTAPPLNPKHHSRNVCVFAEGEVDRSSTGSGVSARAALHYAKGELKLGEAVTIESIVDSTMTTAAVEVTRFGPHDAVIPEVSGTASFVGRNEFYFDPADPFARGFIFR